MLSVRSFCSNPLVEPIIVFLFLEQGIELLVDFAHTRKKNKNKTQKCGTMAALYRKMGTPLFRRGLLNEHVLMVGTCFGVCARRNAVRLSHAGSTKQNNKHIRGNTSKSARCFEAA